MLLHWEQGEEMRNLPIMGIPSGADNQTEALRTDPPTELPFNG